MATLGLSTALMLVSMTHTLPACQVFPLPGDTLFLDDVYPVPSHDDGMDPNSHPDNVAGKPYHRNTGPKPSYNSRKGRY